MVATRKNSLWDCPQPAMPDRRAEPGRAGPGHPRPTSAPALPGRRAPRCVPRGRLGVQPAALCRASPSCAPGAPPPPEAGPIPGWRGRVAAAQPLPRVPTPRPTACAHPAAAVLPVALFPDPSEVTSRRTLPRGSPNSERTRPEPLQKARRVAAGSWQ